MAITKEKKEKIISELTEKFQKSKVAVLTDYKGLSVADISELRKKAREKQIEYKVAKNTLFILASKKAGIEVDEKYFNDQMAIAFGYNDEIDAPKVMNEFSKSHEGFEITGGIIEKRLSSKQNIINLANLPEKEELYAKIVGSLASPLRGILSVMQGNLRGLVSVLNQYKEQKTNN